MSAAEDQLELFHRRNRAADAVISPGGSARHVNNGVGPTNEVPPVSTLRRIETPAARSTDPQSSHDAADLHMARGLRQTHIAVVADAVRACPGLTSAEIAARSCLERHEAARRLPDAMTAGVVRKGPARVCTMSGKLVTTWWPA